MKLVKFFAILFFDIIDEYFHKKKILSFLKKINLKINIFVDVGSHKGTYTDLILKNFDVNRIFMFEPQKDIYKIIKKKYQKNKTIKIFNDAVSNKNTTQKIYINRHDLTSSLVKLDQTNKYLDYKSKLFGVKNVKNMIKDIYSVKTIKLKNIIDKENIEKIGLLKIDTEGHELEVLHGLDVSINKVKCIMIEFHTDKIYLNYNPKKIHNYLIEHNFKLVKTYKFPFSEWEDRLYLNKKNLY
tara:strand:+ start:2540 stop:3262 length:723 start_codon:yes stop_codon:yes gene_type:complete